MSVFEENPLLGLASALGAWRQICIQRGYFHRSSARHYAAISRHDDECEIMGPRVGLSERAVTAGIVPSLSEKGASQ